MPSSARPQAFGRRDSGSLARDLGVGSTAARTSDASVEDLTRRLGLRSQDADACLQAQARKLVVPWSGRAALLAGLITACLTAGTSLLGSKLQAHDSALIAQAAKLAGANAAAVAPMVMLLSLWSAGRATFWTLLTAHFALRKSGRTSLVAYAAGGAFSAVALFFLGEVTGFAGHATLVSTIAVAACAGFFYRLFAGAAPGR